MSSSSSDFPKLSSTNYKSWVGDMRALLMIKEVWSIVNGDSVQPTADDKKELLEWKTKRGKAAGLIFLNLESDQRVHVKGFEEDP
ncbi:hypothetical protein SISNIDRAFT_398810, partial [Sistotremastrum niveocremeum HHB9708]